MSKERERGMSVIVKTVTRLTVGLILLYGVYVVLHGHITPGGGFAGGVIIALSFINLDLAFGKRVSSGILSKEGTGVIEAMGALLFLALALIGMKYGIFFKNFMHPDGEPGELVSAGIIPLENIAIALKVGAGLFGIFLTLIAAQKFEAEKK